MSSSLKTNGYVLKGSDKTVLTSAEVSVIPLLYPHKKKSTGKEDKEHQVMKDNGYTFSHGHDHTWYRKPERKDREFGC